MSEIGVPTTALTWETFGSEVIHIFHEWLYDSKLRFYQSILLAFLMDMDLRPLQLTDCEISPPLVDILVKGMICLPTMRL